MELSIPNKEFVCVEYPGVVVNSHKMLQTLGGERSVTNVFNKPPRRLELRFRPDDLYCKAACGDRHPSSCLLLKVRKKRASTTTGATDLTTTGELQGEIVGIIDTTYKFSSLSDFQYLTMARGEGNEYHSIQHEVHIDGLQPSSWIRQPAQLHLLPTIFSRYDHAGSYCFREPPQPREGRVDTSTLYGENFIGVARQKRPHYTSLFMFSEQNVPTEPYPQVLSKLAIKQPQPHIIESVRMLLEQQPIWSKNALHSNVPHLTAEEMKYILPTIAYYCLSGPWRAMWVRFGYDMRTDPSSKVYQNLDCRTSKGIRNSKNSVKAKRSDASYSLPNTFTKTHQQPSTIQCADLAAGQETPDESVGFAQESRYKFRVGLKPAYRQMFYQLCNIEEPEVQRLIHANDGQETGCTEQDGWCLPGTLDQCRKIINGHLDRLHRSTNTTVTNVQESEVSTKPVLNADQPEPVEASDPSSDSSSDSEEQSSKSSAEEDIDDERME